MAGSAVEVSKDSVKTSYLRFLSDSAPGYVLVLVVLVLYAGEGPPSKWFGGSTELQTFACVLIFVLATPVGLLLSSVSWFILGRAQTRLANLWVLGGSNPLTASTRAAYRFEEVMEHFEIVRGRGEEKPKGAKPRSLYDVASYFEEALRAVLPNVWASVDHVAGVKQLARTTALIAIVLGVRGFFHDWRDGALWLIAAIFLVVLSSLLEYYEDVATLATVMHLDKLAVTQPAILEPPRSAPLEDEGDPHHRRYEAIVRRIVAHARSTPERTLPAS